MNSNSTTQPKPHNEVKKMRLIGLLVFIAIVELVGMSGWFSPMLKYLINIKSCTLIVVNLISVSRFDPYKHCDALLRCLFIVISLLLSPSEYFAPLFSTIQNAFYIGVEFDSLFCQILYSFCSLGPWLGILIMPDMFDPTLQTNGEIPRAAVCLIVVYSFIIITTTTNNKRRLAALKKLEIAYSELRDLNAKNEEMNKSLKELLEDKDNFILSFSHETRNPLNILIGNLTLLLNEIETPNLRTKLLRAKFCSELLLHHLNNILDTGKLTNKNTLEISPVSLNTTEFVQSMWDFMDMMVKKKGLKSELTVERNIPRCVMMDPQRLTQILLNLISNSVKFTTKGSVSLIVSYLKQDKVDEKDFQPTSMFGYKMSKLKENREEEAILNTEENVQEFNLNTSIFYLQKLQREFLKSEATNSVDGFTQPSKGYLKFEISDTGCGIKSEDLEKLFKKFAQVHSDDSQRQIGTGLGLWISKNLAQMMNGDIRVYSKIDIGTTFVVIIEVKIPTDGSPLSMRQCALSPILRLKPEKSKRILLADDDPYNIDVHKQLLINAGYHDITIATNGKELVKIFETNTAEPFYAIITDMNMPELNGISAAKMIREIEDEKNATKRVKIGFITGHANHNDKTTCEQEPINAWFYVSKPVTAAILEGFLKPRGHKEILEYAQDITISTNKYVVLCVDDDLFNLEILNEMLSSFGVTVITAQSGKKAIEIVQSRIKEQRPLDLILMDSHMPEMDGWTASQKIREITNQSSPYVNIPIIGVSGDNKSGNEKKIEDCGMQEWIQKPVQKEDLMRLVKKMIPNSHL